MGSVFRTRRGTIDDGRLAGGSVSASDKDELFPVVEGAIEGAVDAVLVGVAVVVVVGVVGVVGVVAVVRLYGSDAILAPESSARSSVDGDGAALCTRFPFIPLSVFFASPLTAWLRLLLDSPFTFSFKSPFGALPSRPSGSFPMASSTISPKDAPLTS